MPDYKDGKIYKITAEGYDPYYGSTTLPLIYRFRALKCSKNFYSCSPFINLESCRMELVELYPCETRNELMIRERYWIDKNKCVNMTKPFRTNLEKKIYHRNYNRKYMADYVKTHPPKKTTKEQNYQYHQTWLKKKNLFLNELKNFNL